MSQFYISDLKEWHGSSKPCLYNPKSSIGSIMYQAMVDHQDRIAQIFAVDDTKVTRGDLLRQSVRVALNLRGLGVQEGDVVCILNTYNKDVESLLFGSMFILSPFLCMDLEFEKDTLAKDFHLLQPKLIVCEQFKETAVKLVLEELSLNVRVITFDNFNILSAPHEDESIFFPVEENKTEIPFCYVYTSGSTGTSKLASQSHAILISQCIGLLKTPTPNEVVLNFKPLTWVTVILALLNFTVRGVARVITNSSFSPELQARLIKQYKVTMIASTGLEVAKFLDYNDFDLSTIKSFICTGTKLPVQILQQLQIALVNGKVGNVYGSTETSYLSFNFNAAKPYSVGQPIDRVKFKIVNEEGERLEPNEIGEICVKLPTPFLGYYKNSQATSSLYDLEGWIRTGDIGYFDDDAYLYIEGRIKGLLRIKSDQAAHFDESNATKIEEFIAELTGTLEVCVVALGDAEVAYDFPAAALVKPHSLQLTEKDVEKIVAEKFTPHHISGGVYFLEKLPMTPSLKFRRHEVKKMLEKMFVAQKYSDPPVKYPSSL